MNGCAVCFQKMRPSSQHYSFTQCATFLDTLLQCANNTNVVCLEQAECALVSSPHSRLLMALEYYSLSERAHLGAVTSFRLNTLPITKNVPTVLAVCMIFYTMGILSVALLIY